MVYSDDLSIVGRRFERTNVAALLSMPGNAAVWPAISVPFTVFAMTQ
jgi:hypothetical protein